MDEPESDSMALFRLFSLVVDDADDDRRRRDVVGGNGSSLFLRVIETGATAANAPSRLRSRPTTLYEIGPPALKMLGLVSIIIIMLWWDGGGVRRIRGFLVEG